MSIHEQILALPFVKVETLPVHPTKTWDKRDVLIKGSPVLKGMVVHQSLEEYRKASGNAKYHVGSNHISDDGLPGLSYTFFIEADGKVIYANHIEDKPYSQGYSDRPGDENAEFVSVCVGGNFSGPGYAGTQTPTQAQIDSVRRLWNELAVIFNWGNDCLFGHYHFGKPTCPGNDLMEVIDSIRPMTFSSTIERQKALHRLGYYKGEIDGRWGPVSKAALVEFQKVVSQVCSVKVDGVWGDRTSEAVKRALMAAGPES